MFRDVAVRGVLLGRLAPIFSRINITMSSLICESKTYTLSTITGAGRILNADPNYKSSIEFLIPDMVAHDDCIEYITYTIPYAVIPNSFYTINTTNNQLMVTENSINTTYTFGSGNYNASTFMTAFAATLPSRFSITLDANLTMFTVTNTTYDFSFLGTSTIDYIMGFNTTITSSSKVLPMSRVCNFLTLPRICLRCPQLCNEIMVSTTNMTADIILTIPNSASSNGQIVYQNNNTVGNLLVHKITKLVFSLTDDAGNLLNFNGISSFFSLRFDIYRKYLEKPPTFGKLLHLNSFVPIEN